MPTSSKSTLQFRERIHERAARGEALTDDEVEEITRESAELAGVDSGPVDVVDPLRSQWASRADQVLHKPANTINRIDARDMHSKEMRAFERLPAQGSVASHVQSQADRNER